MNFIRKNIFRDGHSCAALVSRWRCAARIDGPGADALAKTAGDGRRAGSAASTFRTGPTMDKWTRRRRRRFRVSRSLKPLEKYRNRSTVVTNLAHPLRVVWLGCGRGSRAFTAVFLSGRASGKGAVHAGVSVDQVLPTHIGPGAPFIHRTGNERSRVELRGRLRLRLLPIIDFLAQSTMPLPMENSPQVVFESPFRRRQQCSVAVSRKKEDRTFSIRSRRSRPASIQARSGDRARLTEYLDDIREIERRIQKAENNRRTKERS